MGLVDKNGVPLDPVERATHKMAREIVEAMYGVDAEGRVRELRRSVRGGDDVPAATIAGLAAALP